MYPVLKVTKNEKYYTNKSRLLLIIKYSASTYLIPLSDVQDAGEFTEIAYKDFDAISTSNGFKVIETIHKTMDGGEKIKAIVAFNHDKNEMVIAFRGSSRLEFVIRKFTTDHYFAVKAK